MVSSALTRPQRRLASAQWLLTMGYDGARFHGVQPQPGILTVAEALRRRVYKASGLLPRALSFAARTDAGVHAVANLASLRLPATASGVEQVMMCRDDGLRDVRILRLPRRVMARAMTAAKHYRYVVEDGAVRAYASGVWCLGSRLDVGRMQHAARHLTGTHGFSAWRDRGCQARQTEVTLTAVNVSEVEASNDTPRRVVIDVHGDRFLRKMVRIMVGTLVEVGCGQRSAHSMVQLLQQGQRSAVGMTAPACGLTLQSVRCAPPWATFVQPLAPGGEPTA